MYLLFSLELFFLKLFTYILSNHRYSHNRYCRQDLICKRVAIDFLDNQIICTVRIKLGKIEDLVLLLIFCYLYKRKGLHHYYHDNHYLHRTGNHSLHLIHYYIRIPSHSTHQRTTIPQKMPKNDIVLVVLLVFISKQHLLYVGVFKY